MVENLGEETDAARLLSEPEGEVTDPGWESTDLPMLFNGSGFGLLKTELDEVEAVSNKLRTLTTVLGFGSSSETMSSR